jgi:ribosome-binding factor A
MIFKAYREQSISKQMMRIVQTTLLECVSIFDMHNFKYNSQLVPEDVNIVKILVKKGLRSATIYYFIDSISQDDKNFIIFNKHLFFKKIKKQIKMRICPNIVFKYDKSYIDNCYQHL